MKNAVKWVVFIVAAAIIAGTTTYVVNAMGTDKVSADSKAETEEIEGKVEETVAEETVEATEETTEVVEETEAEEQVYTPVMEEVQTAPTYAAPTEEIQVVEIPVEESEARHISVSEDTMSYEDACSILASKGLPC